MTSSTQFFLAFAGIVFLIGVAFAFALTFSNWDENEEIEERPSAQHKDEPADEHNGQRPSPSSPNDKSYPDHRRGKKTYASSQARLINVAAGLNVLTGLAAIAGLLGLYVVYGTLNITKTTLLLSERPYVTIGQPNGGLLADWERDKTGNITGLIIYFQNSGNTPAFQLYVNLLPTPGSLPSRNFAHLPSNWLTGDVVASHSTVDKHVLNFAGKHISDLLKGGTSWRWSRRFTGDFEYLNIFGEYCCEPFSINLEYDRWWIGSPPAHSFVCPNSPNVCEQYTHNPADDLVARFGVKSTYDNGLIP